jgi:hypothetical protein
MWSMVPDEANELQSSVKASNSTRDRVAERSVKRVYVRIVLSEKAANPLPDAHDEPSHKSLGRVFGRIRFAIGRIRSNF